VCVGKYSSILNCLWNVKSESPGVFLLMCKIFFFFEPGPSILPRLDLNSRAEVILLAQPPEQLGL
jgi:hypothetical protein